MFDHYVSLGNNCEVAFQIRRVLGRDSSSFFSWNVTPFNALISLLRSDFHDLLSLSNLTNEPERGLMYDASHQYKFHSPFQTHDFRQEADFIVKFRDMAEKSSYLVEKFKHTARSGARVAYFYKTEEVETTESDALKVASLLGQLHGAKDFALIVARQDAARGGQSDPPGVHYRYLRRLAPWTDATDGHVQSWDRIFMEFPHRQGLHLAGF